MQLEEADIQEFAELWQDEFNETLSSGEVQTRASILLELYALFAKTPTEVHVDPPDDLIP